eukprot:scaffold149192_cov14-Tisochrysis_lutea.AAC.1
MAVRMEWYGSREEESKEGMAALRVEGLRGLGRLQARSSAGLFVWAKANLALRCVSSTVPYGMQMDKGFEEGRLVPILSG